MNATPSGIPIADELIDPKQLRYEITALGKAALHWEEPIAAFDVESLFVQYLPRLTGIAIRHGLSRDDAECVAIETLGDVALRIIGGGVAPSAIEPYLIAAIMNRVRRFGRDESRRGEKTATAADEAPGGNERCVPACYSEFTLHSAHPSDSDDSEVRPFIVALVTELMRELHGEAEASLLMNTSNHVPVSQSASEFGKRSTALRARLSRLRHRLRERVPSILQSLDESERRETERLLRRAGILPVKDQQ